MSILSNEHWRELAPDFEASEMLCDVADLLEGHPGTCANARKLVMQALARLHPVTRSREAREEYEARRDGCYVPPPPPTLHHARSYPPRIATMRPDAPDPRDALIADLAARLAALERPPPEHTE